MRQTGSDARYKSEAKKWVAQLIQGTEEFMIQKTRVYRRVKENQMGRGSATETGNEAGHREETG